MANRFVLNETSYHGKGAIKEIASEIKARGFAKALVCSDPDLIKFGVTKKVTDVLDAAGIAYDIFSDIKPNPTIENVQNGVKAFKESGADCIVAVGGGSPMDCAKGVGARVARPTSTVKQLGAFVFMVAIPVTSLPKVTFNGYFPPKLYAVPTTAGTGSETTIAAVITDMQTHDKFPITDPLIRANVAVLDPELTTGLPKKVTSTTGLDALTHAVEGYTNIWYNDKKFNDKFKAIVEKVV